MPKPGEHKTVQARLLRYAQEDCWIFVSRAEARNRRGFAPHPNPLPHDKKLGDYVIVHELLHFSAPNHGKLWKRLMRAHLGDSEALEARLKKKIGAWYI